MKKISALFATGILFLTMSGQLVAQNNADPNVTIIKPYALSITFFKTTHLIFPYAIKSVDRGSKDILVQKAKEVTNILQVKAGRVGFDPTNLTVITADGKLYSYILNYTDTPSVLNIRFDDSTAEHPEAYFSDGSVNEAQIKAKADMVAMAKETVRGIRDRSDGIRMKLSGVYVNEGVLFLRLNMQNYSTLNYDVDQLRFFIKDEKKWKRTATQELEISPLYAGGDTSSIVAQSERVFVYALHKFTIPDKKYLAIELIEKSGGRNLKLRVHNKTIVRAMLLP